ncbi:MAG: hypothetical protein LKE33_04100 [Acidaminococcus sp.]|jgi:hypothetical protein|nr:hypothetical protein [Acidaminococcus sp.]MCI2101148.1 hypothetical protein [Acidaminococcus sp.]
MMDMEMNNLPWKNEPGIFNLIKEHLDENGFFAPEQIKDKNLLESYPTVFLDPGAADIFLSDMHIEGQEGLAEPIWQTLIAYAENPDPETAKKIYYGLSATPFIFYYDAIVELMSQAPIPDALWQLCNDWLHEAINPEPIKLAITVAGLYLLNEENLNRAQSLKKDLMLMARCEEFTNYVIYALELGHMLEENDLWEIMNHTNRWGRVSAMEMYNYVTPEEKHWLLLNGWDLNVDYPAISLLILKRSDMMDLLEQDAMSAEDFAAVMHTVVDYVDFLLNFEPPTRRAAEEMPVIQLYSLLQKCILHAKAHHKTLEEAAVLMNLSRELQTMVDQKNWDQLSMNQCHTLISAIESLVYETPWKEILPKHLLNEDGSTNLLAVQMAYAMEIPIHTRLWNLLKKDPMRTELYPFLLSTESKRSFDRVLAFAEAHVNEYLVDERTIVPLLVALTQHPGEGENILAPALTSLYESVRANAITVLETWPDKNWSPTIQLALMKAKEMTAQPFLTLRLNELLRHRALQVEDLSAAFFSHLS